MIDGIELGFVRLVWIVLRLELKCEKGGKGEVEN